MIDHGFDTIDRAHVMAVFDGRTAGTSASGTRHDDRHERQRRVNVVMAG